jgi:protein involved in polysaccharide export with SLBB domain
MKVCAASVLIAVFTIALAACLSPASVAAQSLDARRKALGDVEKASLDTGESTDEAQAKLLAPTSKTPILEKAVDPDSYVLGPFDRLVMTIMGTEPRTYLLSVLPEGDVLVPMIGPIRADGLTLTEFRRVLASKVEIYFRNIELYCYLETPAQFRVFVTGEVADPGVVAVSGVERVVDALDKAGSVKGNGSLRNIALERGGSSIRVDLLRFLAQGDLKNNPFLRSGDRINVPPAGWHASISGRVNKASGYEILEGETIADLIGIAGGFAAEALEDSVLLKRVGSGGEVTVANVTKDRFGMPLQDGDEVSVYDRLKDRRYVTVAGAVIRSGQFELARGEKLSTLIVRAGGFRQGADLTAAYLEKRNGPVVKLDLQEYLSPAPSKDLSLEDGDALTIPFVSGRVAVGGEVNEPGAFDYSSDLTVVQYIGLAGGPTKEGSVDRVVVYSPDGRGHKAGPDAHVNHGDVIVVKRASSRVLGDFFRGVIQLGTVVISIIILSNQ